MNREYDVTSRCNLGLVFLLIELQINKIETSYITIHKVYYFGGPVRSQSPHGPNDTSWDIALVLMEEFFLKGSHSPLFGCPFRSFSIISSTNILTVG